MAIEDNKFSTSIRNITKKLHFEITQLFYFRVQLTIKNAI